MRRPSWLRRSPDGWPQLRRELEEEGVTRIGVQSQAPAREADPVGRLGPCPERFANHDLARKRGERVIDDEAIQNAAQRLWEAAPAGTRLFVFGSHAWAQASARSDLDLLVVEPDPVPDAAAEAVRLRRTLRGLLIAVDILVVSAKNAREWRGVPNSLAGAAMAEGRELTRR